MADVRNYAIFAIPLLVLLGAGALYSRTRIKALRVIGLVVSLVGFAILTLFYVVGVGAAFNFHSGHIQRAPKWMQKSGLEWLYRIYKEKRLLKRYLTTNPIFMFLLIRDFILIRVLKFKNSE